MRHVKVRWKGVVLQWKEIKMAFQLAACAEMLWQDKPIHWRAARLNEMGFGVGLWNWPAWDLDALENTGAKALGFGIGLRGIWMPWKTRAQISPS
jgi:hypothetical protein